MMNKPLPIWTQIYVLWRMEVANWRRSWQIIVLGGIVGALFYIIFVGILMRQAGPEALAYVLSGNVVASLLFATRSFAENRFIFMRTSDTLDYFATLPIWRNGLIVAVVAAALALSIPGLLTVIFVGSRILSLELALHPLLWLVLPLSTLPFAALGALIGTITRSYEESNTVSTAVILTLILLGPVTVPPTMLPEILIILGRFNPAVYTASAFRQLIIGPVTPQLIYDLIAITTFTIATLWFVGRHLEWQQK